MEVTVSDRSRVSHEIASLASGSSWWGRGSWRVGRDPLQQQDPIVAPRRELPLLSSALFSGIYRERERERVLVLSHIQFFATPWTVAHQAPLSMGYREVTLQLAQFISLTLARILFNKNLQSERMTQ